jgi:tetratricopeptide (TPR) repeat protein
MILKLTGDLAETYENLGKWDAEVGLREELLATKQALPHRHLEKMAATIKLADAYKNKGDIASAEKLYQVVLGSNEGFNNRVDPEQWARISHVARAYIGMGQWEKGLELQEKVGKEWDHLVAQIDSKKLTGMSVLGNLFYPHLIEMHRVTAIYRHHGRWDRVITLLEKGIEAATNRDGSRADLIRAHSIRASSEPRFLRSWLGGASNEPSRPGVS